MTPTEIRDAVRRALDAMYCHCYDTTSMEYGDRYPCEKCELNEAAVALSAMVEADCGMLG